MVSIIIPSIDNRENLLKRSIRFYSKYEFEIHVVDGSKKKKKINYNNVKYHHLPHLNVAKRLKYVLKKIKNKIILICQDDDFINIPVLKKGIKILKKNKTISWLGGDQVYFSKYFGKYYFQRLQNNINNNDYSSNNIQKRALFFTKYQQQLMASIFRKKDLSMALNNYLKTDLNIQKNKEKINIYYETIYSIFMSIQGRYYHINDVWQFRDLKVYFNTNSRPIKKINWHDVKNSKATKNLKTFISKQIKPTSNFSYLFDKAIVYRKGDYGSNYYIDNIKYYLKNYLFPIFIFLKTLNYFVKAFKTIYFNTLNNKLKKYKNLNKYWLTIENELNHFNE